MAWFTRFAIDDLKQVVVNTAYVLPSVDPLIMCCLNSPLAWWYMWRTAQHGKDEVLRLIRDYTETFPIPKVDAKTTSEISKIAHALAQHGVSMNEFEETVVSDIRKTIDCQIDGAAAFDLVARPPEKFIARLAKLCDQKRFDASEEKVLTVLRQECRQQRQQLLTRQLELERQLADVVESAYGLTQEEKALLRSTRPPRDPLDVLEHKIDGNGDEDEDLEADD